MLEADFQRFYNLDLADLYRGTLGVRKAAVLAVHLPPESATKRAEGGNSGLTIEEHQLRNIEHRLDLLLYQGGGGKGAKPQPPKPPQQYMEKKRQRTRLHIAAERSRMRAQQAMTAKKSASQDK